MSVPSGPSVLRRLAIVPLLAAGIAALLWLQRTRTEPETLPPTERSLSVRVIEARPVDLIPRAVSHGTVRPARTWVGVAQVGGSVTTMHANLRVGSFVEDGALLVRIDSTEYALAVAQASAQIDTIGAQLAELDVQEKTQRASLGIEERSLGIARSQVERIAREVASGSASPTEKETLERAALDQENRTQQVRNALALLPSRRRVLETQLTAERAHLERAQLDLQRCEIRAPFTGRVASLEIEVSQVVRPGQALCSLDGVDVAEIPARFAMTRLRPLVLGRPDRDPEELLRRSDFADVLGLTARARIRAGTHEVEWVARFVRVEMVDPQTRTVPIVVAVDDPYRDQVPGVRPPLFKGIDLEVELRGGVLPGRMVIPRSALHAGNVVYLAGPDDRLEIREVRPAFTQGALVCIGSGLAAGDRVVVSDVLSATIGTLLHTTPDADVEQSVLSAARGEGDVR